MHHAQSFICGAKMRSEVVQFLTALPKIHPVALNYPHVVCEILFLSHVGLRTKLTPSVWHFNKHLYKIKQ